MKSDLRQNGPASVACSEVTRASRRFGARNAKKEEGREHELAASSIGRIWIVGSISLSVKSISLPVLLEQTIRSSARGREGQNVRRQRKTDRPPRPFRPIRHGKSSDQPPDSRPTFLQQLIRRFPDDIGSNRYIPRNELTCLLIPPRSIPNRPALRPEPEVANHINTLHRLTTRLHRCR
jgi:hypothetical protein